MRTVRTLVLATVGLTGTFVLTVGSGVAIGSALTSVSKDGVVSACVQAGSGALRVADSTEDCTRAELPLTWQQGQAPAAQVHYVKTVVRTANPADNSGPWPNPGPSEIATVPCPTGSRIVSGQRLDHESSTGYTLGASYVDSAANAYVVQHNTGWQGGDETSVLVACVG